MNHIWDVTMNIRIVVSLVAISLTWCSAYDAQAGGDAPQRGLRNRRAHGAVAGGDCKNGECGGQTCRTVMKTVNRTVYEMVQEQKQKTVYDIVMEEKVINNVQRIPITQHQTQEYSYMRPVVHTLTREVPYTVSRPVRETLNREVSYMTYYPVCDTHTRMVSYTVQHAVQETRTRTVHRSCPRKVSYTKTVPIHSGRWETCVQEVPVAKCSDGAQKGSEQKSCGTKRVCKRVWIPHVEYREVTRHKTVYDMRAEEVPYKVTRYIPEVRMREVEYTVSRMVPVTNTRTVHYQVMKMIQEQHTRTVSYNVTQMIPETGTRVVPVTTYREVPTSSTIHMPRRVPRTVCYTVTKCVPRTVCVQVPVTVCGPSDPKGGASQKSGSPQKGDSNWPSDEYQRQDVDSEAPAEVPEPPTVAASASLRLASLTQTQTDEQTAADRFAAGLAHYRTGSYQAAMEAFEAALNADAKNAKYAYFSALTQREVGQLQRADWFLALGLQLEQAEPIANWGRVMQRVQGQGRIWMETARSQGSVLR